MDDLVSETENYIKLGSSMGYKDGELQNYVKSCFERKERALERGVKERENDKQREFELQKLKIEHNVKSESSDPKDTDNGQFRSFHPKLPLFDENKDEIDAFISRFESQAEMCKWPKAKWPMYIAPLFKGAALSLYYSLSASDTLTWEILKSELLKKFQCSEDGFREKFRSVRPENGESFTAYLIRCRHLLERWIELSEINKDFDSLFDLFLREQLLQSFTTDLAVYLKERKFVNAKELCDSAELYREARKGQNFAKKGASLVFANVSSNGSNHSVSENQTEKNKFHDRNSNNYRGNNRGYFNNRGFSRGQQNQYSRGRGFQSNFNAQTPNQSNENVDKTQRGRGNFGNNYRGNNRFQRGNYQNYNNQIVQNKLCVGCGLQGHLFVNCFKSIKIAQNKGKPESAKEGNVCLANFENANVNDSNTNNLKIEDCTVNGFKATMLRDTGCSTAGVRMKCVNTDQYTGETQKCKTFGGRIEEFPLAIVTVQTPYYSGPVTCCVINDPVSDLILGNLPGVSTVTGGNVGSFVPIDNVAYVMTRAQSKANNSKTKTLEDCPVIDVKIDSKDLISMQNNDKSLKSCYDKVIDNSSQSTQNAYFYIEKDILFRNFSDKNEIKKQIVVPTDLRYQVLHTAHDALMSGHFGVRRTLQRVLCKFYWPTVSKDVNMYCKSCDACQRTTAKGRVPSAPLEQMPLIDEPFKRIAIDLIGPMIPISNSGYRFVLTIMDVATRYPEAIPLKKIDSITCAEALFTVFSRMGCPVEILTDQGSQFCSDLMKEIHKLLGIKHFTTTPYHAQSNGLVERFNGVLKTMLRKMCQDHPKEWDKYIPALLFAYRDLPNVSTGFSPFELMFGRIPRGPISILADIWTGDKANDEKCYTHDYVFQLRNKIKDTCMIAQENVKDASFVYKHYHDKKSKFRSLEPGDKVLILLSLETSKLLLSWKGPFSILSKLSPVNYLVDMNGKKKIYHINMLKKYFERESVGYSCYDMNEFSKETVVRTDKNLDFSLLPFANADEQDFLKVKNDEKIACSNEIVKSVLSTAMLTDDSNDETLLPTPSVTGENFTDVKINPDLSSGQKYQLEQVFSHFSDIITDKPGNVTEMDFFGINLENDTPIRLKPYPLPFASKEVVMREIKSMLDMGVIEESCSPYSCPIVLVKKPDGSIRFCNDFRALNKITVFDAEPIPNPDELFCQLAKDKFFTKIDLTKGYWQFFIKPEDRFKTAFQTPFGLYQWIKLPFGLVNAPAFFARMMRKLNLEQMSSLNFFDDILVHSKNFENHLKDVSDVLNKLSKFGITARPTKLHAGFTELEFLGHIIGNAIQKPSPSKVEKILKISVPKSKKQVRSLLGLLGYYRRYIQNFSTLTKPLSDLTKDDKSKSIKWDENCIQAVNNLQMLFSSYPILMLPDLSKPFTLRTDASGFGIGAVLLQEHDDVLHPVIYASRKLLDRETRYSTIERECLAIVWAIQKLQRYLSFTHFVLQTDHRPLTYLNSSRLKNSRLMRWSLALQEFNFDVKPISGTMNQLADLLSRSNQNQIITKL